MHTMLHSTVLKIFLILAALAAIQHTSCATDPCNAPRYCDQGSPYLPDPTDCRVYYECVYGNYVSRLCANGSLFDSVKLECVHDDNVQCQQPCPPVTGCIIDEPELSPGLCNEDNQTTCVEGKKYPDRSDCTWYYLCQFGYIYTRMPCPTYQVFALAYSDCTIPNSTFVCERRCDDWVASKECITTMVTTEADVRTTGGYGDVTTTGSYGDVTSASNSGIDPCDKPAFCDNGSPYVPDPTDCRQYYECLYDNWILRPCGNGTLFDSETLECVDDDIARCQQPCPTQGAPPSLSPGLCDADNRTTCVEGSKYPDRSDCTFYYLCEFGNTYTRVQCPALQVFYIEYADCSTPNSTFDCEYRCQTPAPKSAVVPVASHKDTRIDPCDMPEFCDSGSDFVPYPVNCRLFYACVYGHWETRECAAGTLFDGSKLECLTVEKAVCHTPCRNSRFRGSRTVATTLLPGLCAEDSTTACVEGMMYPDRSNCTTYYLCKNGRFVMTMCPRYQVFHVDLSRCDIPNSSFDCDYRCKTPARAIDTAQSPDKMLPDEFEHSDVKNRH